MGGVGGVVGEKVGEGMEEEKKGEPNNVLSSPGHEMVFNYFSFRIPLNGFSSDF